LLLFLDIPHTQTAKHLILSKLTSLSKFSSDSGKLQSPSWATLSCLPRLPGLRQQTRYKRTLAGVEKKYCWKLAEISHVQTLVKKAKTMPFPIAMIEPARQLRIGLNTYNESEE
jgi:hypothetical protein